MLLRYPCRLRDSGLHILSLFSTGRGRLVISLSASLISRAELFLLIVEHVASAIHPLTRLLFRPASLLTRLLAALLCLGAQHFARFIAGARRIQHTDHSSNSEPCQKPQETSTITICHNCLLFLYIGW